MAVVLDDPSMTTTFDTIIRPVAALIETLRRALSNGVSFGNGALPSPL